MKNIGFGNRKDKFRHLAVPGMTCFALMVFMAVFFGGCATTPVGPYYPPGKVMSCFYDFTDVYQRRIYPTLSNAPGVYGLSRDYNACPDGAPCLCYQLQYEGSMESLESWIYSRLPTSKAVPFRIVTRNSRWLEVYFQGGFE